MLGWFVTRRVIAVSSRFGPAPPPSGRFGAAPPPPNGQRIVPGQVLDE
jgi:hypothetical protein